MHQKMEEAFFAVEHVSYGYAYQKRHIQILKDVHFSLNPGQVTALMGPSGAGKSTLLHLAGLLDTPATGDVMLGGQRSRQLSDKERTHLRSRYLGFVYQFHHLLPDFSALENVCVPQWLRGVPTAVATKKALELLTVVGLKDRLSHRPGELSGGEQQRIALARALANDPKVLLADEPTGNLDQATGQTVFSLLRTLARDKNMAVLMATHNPELASQMDRIFYLNAGTLSPTPS